MCTDNQLYTAVYIVSKTTPMLHTNFNAHRPILVIVGKDVESMLSTADLLSHTSPIANVTLCTTWGNMNPGNCVFSVMLYTVSGKRHRFGLRHMQCIVIDLII